MAKILLIIPYDFYPPRYGGALRCFYLLRELAKRHDVWLLTTQQAEDFQNHQAPSFPENVRVVSTASEPGYRTIMNIFPERLANAVNSRILKRSLRGKGNLYLLKTYPVLKRVLAETDFDFVHYENLECFTVLSPHVHHFAPRVAQVYDAHNVDSELWLQLSESEANPVLKTYAATAFAIESQLYKQVSLCLACSEIDKKKLERLNDGVLNVEVIPNGVDTDARPYDSNNHKQEIANILFCGTLDYTPNTRGLIWFYENVFPLLRKEKDNLTLTIVGKMNTPGPYQKLQDDPAVRFIGPVDSVEPYYQESSLAIVPILSGSGTRLKILEAMSMGNPVVSTSIGAEGLRVEDGRQIRIADDPQHFATAIIGLLSDRELFEKQREEAREFVENHYDWSVIGETLNKSLHSVLQKKNKGAYVRLDQ